MCRTPNMDVFTVHTAPRAAPPSAPATARWAPGPPPAEVSTLPSPPPAYSKVYDPNSDELRDWEDRNH